MSADRRRRQLGPDMGPQPVADSIAKVLSRIGAAPTAQTLELLFTRWEEVVGPELARHVQPQRLQNAILVVAADHPVWATRARMEAERIRARARELGDSGIERVEVVVQRP